MLVFAAVYDETTGTNDSLGWTRWYFFGASWGNFRRRRIARIFEVPCCRGSGDLLVSWWVRKPRARLRKLDKLGVGDGGKVFLGFSLRVSRVTPNSKPPSTSPRDEGICDDGDMWWHRFCKFLIGAGQLCLWRILYILNIIDSCHVMLVLSRSSGSWYTGRLIVVYIFPCPCCCIFEERHICQEKESNYWV